MVAVGLWACTLGGRAILAVPAAFVGTMMLGFVAAMLELPLPFVEPVILASVVVIGLLSAVALRLPTGPAMALIGFFAFFHGHAHGGELGSAGAMEFAVGFAIATALLHGAGIGLGWLLGRSSGLTGTRIAGAATALAGLWLAVAG
jgi:urease accessory protein